MDSGSSCFVDPCLKNFQPFCNFFVRRPIFFLPDYAWVVFVPQIKAASFLRFKAGGDAVDNSCIMRVKTPPCVILAAFWSG
jgi:hypothetical protein